MTPEKLEVIARVMHEANRAFCAAHGDRSQVPWDDASDDNRRATYSGIEFRLANPNEPVDAQHNDWMRDKIAAGWTYGPVKDTEKKTHPCLVPYSQLPLFERQKDALVVAVVEALK